MYYKEDVANIAIKVANAKIAGKKFVTINGITFNVIKGGYCARFVRQAHEAAMKLPEFSWLYSSPNALEMEKKLKANNTKTSYPQRGDIVAINRKTGKYGHIGIYIGNGKFVENTSSTKRGPGTVISNIKDVEDRITGYYSVLPTYNGPKIIVNGKQIQCNFELRNDVLWVGLRSFIIASDGSIAYNRDTDTITIKV